jgi:hypothetical protein
MRERGEVRFAEFLLRTECDEDICELTDSYIFFFFLSPWHLIDSCGADLWLPALKGRIFSSCFFSSFNRISPLDRPTAQPLFIQYTIHVFSYLEFLNFFGSNFKKDSLLSARPNFSLRRILYQRGSKNLVLYHSIYFLFHRATTFVFSTELFHSIFSTLPLDFFNQTRRVFAIVNNEFLFEIYLHTSCDKFQAKAFYHSSTVII